MYALILGGSEIDKGTLIQIFLFIKAFDKKKGTMYAE